MKKNFSLFFAITLGLIILLGGWLRLYHLGQLPAILNRDEAALAYNAKLMGETGKDEWQQSWPLTLKSFGDYKLVGYVWLIIPLLKAFGEQDWVVRLPSALAGVWLIFMAYLWAKDLFQLSRKTSLYVAAAAALTPVLFFYSRSAFEANVALALTTTALWCWWKPHSKGQLGWDAFGIGVIFLAVLTYNTPLLLLPVFILLTAWVRSLTKVKTWPVLIGMVVVFIAGFLIVLPATSQKQGISIFTDATIHDQFITYREQFSGLPQKIFANQYVFFLGQMFTRYLNTWLPEFAVVKGGAHPWHSLPGFGHLLWTTYLVGLLGLFIGTWLIVRGVLAQPRRFFAHQKTRLSLALIGLTLAAPLPAVITVDAPHATRSLIWFFCVVLLGGWTIELLQKQTLGRWSLMAKILVTILLMTTAMEAMRYQYVYWVQYPQRQYVLFGYGFAEELQKLPKDKPVAVIDSDGYQYITAAWYLHLTPDEYFATIQHHLPDRIGFQYGYKVANLRFIAHEADKFPEEKYLLGPDATHWRMIEY